FVDVRRRDRPAEARPAAAGLELRGRRKQRLAGYHVDVDPRLGGVQVLAGARALGGVLLGDAVLLGGQPGEGVGALAVGSHGRSPEGVPAIWGHPRPIKTARNGIAASAAPTTRPRMASPRPP